MTEGVEDEDEDVFAAREGKEAEESVRVGV